VSRLHRSHIRVEGALDDRSQPAAADAGRPAKAAAFSDVLCQARRARLGRSSGPVAKGGRLGAKRLTDKSVCNLVKAYAKRIGLDPAAFGAHSLRSGFLTSAARRGASVFKMRDVSRHKSMDVLQAYVRDADMFRDHAGAGLL
jgi:hypothetical protein